MSIYQFFFITDRQTDAVNMKGKMYVWLCHRKKRLNRSSNISLKLKMSQAKLKRY